MKKSIFIIVFSLIAALSYGDLYAKDKQDPGESVSKSLKLNALKKKKEKLQKDIAAQDAKRNKVIPGVDPFTLEQINDRQDSLCLVLRSQLVDVNLEIQEQQAPGSAVSPKLVDQYKNLVKDKK